MALYSLGLSLLGSVYVLVSMFLKSVPGEVLRRRTHTQVLDSCTDHVGIAVCAFAP